MDFYAEVDESIQRRPSGVCEDTSDSTLDISTILKSPVTIVVGLGLVGFLLLG